MDYEQRELNFSKVSGGQVDEFWKPETPGAQITGKLIGSFDSNFGKCYMVEARGHVFGMPSHTILQNVLMKVPVGNIVRITYTGTQPNKNNQPLKTYEVEQAPDPDGQA